MFVCSICMYSMYVFHVLILCVYCSMLIVYSMCVCASGRCVYVYVG